MTFDKVGSSLVKIPRICVRLQGNRENSGFIYLFIYYYYYYYYYFIEKTQGNRET